MSTAPALARRARWALPGLALAGALGLLLPGTPLRAYSLLGGVLDLDQRDVRVFKNFADPSADDNVTPDPQFPGALGLELAMWKAVVEWGSGPHGDGSGDPTQGVLGSGGANFDALWAGQAAGVGTKTQNIASATTGCTGGTIAFMESPLADGWRIRFCDNSFVFEDDPALGIGGRFDIQAIMAHEYGHALGLGHSTFANATMWPSASSGSLAERSINVDDANGVKAVYGPKSASKPQITGIDVFGGGTKMTIHGTNFAPAGVRVWFRGSAVTGGAADPIVQSPQIISLAGGTELTLTIPAAAAPGDVMVRNPGSTSVHSLLSNAFPSAMTDTVAGPSFSVTSLDPSTVEALVPGTDQFLTISGSGLASVQSITLNPSSELDPSAYTIVSDSTITVDLPQANGLGTASLKLFDGAAFENVFFDVVAPASPKLQLGTGDDFNVTASGQNLSVITAGAVGTQHRVFFSASPVPSSVPILTLQLGNNFSSLFQGPTFTIPAPGYFVHLEPIQLTTAATDFYAQSVDITTPPSPSYAVSNLQIITLTP